MLVLTMDIAWAVLRTRRTSLKDGATNRREEMKRRRSCQAKASWRGRAVKNVPIEGTRSLSFDLDSDP